MRELPLSMRVPLVASNELAIVTKSIAFVSPPRTTDNLVENCPYLSGGRDALSNTSGECVVAKANEADCGAQTPKWKSPEGKEGANLI